MLFKNCACLVSCKPARTQRGVGEPGDPAGCHCGISVPGRRDGAGPIPEAAGRCAPAWPRAPRLTQDSGTGSRTRSVVPLRGGEGAAFVDGAGRESAPARGGGRPRTGLGRDSERRPGPARAQEGPWRRGGHAGPGLAPRYRAPTVAAEEGRRAAGRTAGPAACCVGRTQIRTDGRPRLPAWSPAPARSACPEAPFSPQGPSAPLSDPGPCPSPVGDAGSPRATLSARTET